MTLNTLTDSRLTGYPAKLTKTSRQHLGKRFSATIISLFATFTAVPNAFAESGEVAAPVVGQLPGFSSAIANEEAYWYSRYSMMTLTMQSGLGTTIPMDQKFMDMMQQMMSMVGAAATDPVIPPVNSSLLLTIYAGGDPHYAAAPNQMDFSTLKWAGGPAILTTEATATTMTKELEWAKLFHRNQHFGQAGVDNFGSTQRFIGVMLANMVKMQMQSYLADQANYKHTKAGDYALLTALSDGAGLYSSTDQANNQGPNASPATYPVENRYSDPAAEEQFITLAKAQFSKVLNSKPHHTRDLSLAIQSMVWYASISQDAAELKLAKMAIFTWANQLSAEHSKHPVDLAYKVRGLIEAGRVSGEGKYLDQAAIAFNRMIADFDNLHGILHGVKSLTIDDVAEITGSFNAAGIWLGQRIDQLNASDTFGAWWEGSVNLSGLEISSPAVNQMKGTYERLNPPGRGQTNQPIFDYRYPSVPLPENAGGEYGIAPVFAAKIAWHGDEWQADKNHFDTAGAMRAANEMIWLHSDEINGFPQVSLP